MTSFVAISFTMAITRAMEEPQPKGSTVPSASDSCTNETMTVHGTIYADNWFKFYFNGEHIHTDPVDFTPHNAENVTFTAPVCGEWTFAIYATDYSDNITGLYALISAIVCIRSVAYNVENHT